MKNEKTFKSGLRIVEQLERLGKWKEAKKEYTKFLADSEYKMLAQEALARLEEKERIYQKVNSIYKERLGAKSYIGEDDFLCLSKDNISIHFHIKNQNLDLTQLFRIIKRAEAKIEESLGYKPEKVVIEIMNTQDELKGRAREREGLKLRSWVGGMQADVIRVNAESLASSEPQNLAVFLTHEYVHLAVYEMTKGNAPWWLSEGLAIYFSQNLSDEYLEILAKAAAKNKTLDLEILGRDPSELADDRLRKLAYAQAGSVSEYLISKLGWDKIKDLLTSLRKKSLSDALAKYGLNLYLIQREWQRWFQVKESVS